jgi:hypothetical protein
MGISGGFGSIRVQIIAVDVIGVDVIRVGAIGGVQV